MSIIKTLSAHFLIVINALLLSVFLVGCASNGQTSGAPVESTSKAVYQLGQADGLRIDVWRRPELSIQVTVRPDGMISMPLIGDVMASGKTASTLADEITRQLSNFVKTPQVTVIVTNSVSAAYQQRVRVTGAVNRQLSIPFRDGMTVLDVVLEAGGTTIFAAANKAKLFRKNVDGVMTPYVIKLSDILLKGKLDTNYRLQPSDVITVPEKSF